MVDGTCFLLHGHNVHNQPLAPHASPALTTTAATIPAATGPPTAAAITNASTTISNPKRQSKRLVVLCVAFLTRIITGFCFVLYIGSGTSGSQSEDRG